MTLGELKEILLKDYKNIYDFYLQNINLFNSLLLDKENILKKTLDIRANIFDNTVDITSSCKKCNKINSSIVELNSSNLDIVFKNRILKDNEIKFLKTILDDFYTLDLFIKYSYLEKKEINEYNYNIFLNLDEDKIYKYLINSNFNIKASFNCIFCGTQNDLNLTTYEIEDYLNIFSKLDLESIYKVAVNFKKFLNFSLFETYSIKPFEVDIYTSLFKESEK